jgi:site-specific DNA-methyltransferase (adenine-specific)/site-specific DNA-methyltransferase (cytosine-N4-specific)
MTMETNKILCGDCEEVMRSFPDNCIDLIVTSPPYADQRKHTYGGIEPDKYVEWFLPKSKEMFRVLKPTGSFILNIKERVVSGERHTYVLELILALRKQGWLWTEEYIWHKPNAMPGKWPNRFRDSWERLLHFTKNKKIKMFQDNVTVPMSRWTELRFDRMKENDNRRRETMTKSGFGINMSALKDKSTAYPTNVLFLTTESHNKGHSAVFPIKLPEFFIKLFTEENDIVLDPFAGSGTTSVATINLNRKFLAIDNIEENCNTIRQRIKSECNQNGKLW